MPLRTATGRLDSGRRAGGESAESSAPLIGCIGCLAVVAVAVVDLVPFIALQAALAPGRHALWAAILIAIIGLGSGPAVALLVAYFGFKATDRLAAAMPERWRQLARKDNPLGPNLSDAALLAVVAITLVAGAACGLGVLTALDAVLP